MYLYRDEQIHFQLSSNIYSKYKVFTKLFDMVKFIIQLINEFTDVFTDIN